MYYARLPGLKTTEKMAIISRISAKASALIRCSGKRLARIGMLEMSMSQISSFVMSQGANCVPVLAMRPNPETKMTSPKVPEIRAKLFFVTAAVRFAVTTATRPIKADK